MSFTIIQGKKTKYGSQLFLHVDTCTVYSVSMKTITGQYFLCQTDRSLKILS